MMRISSEELCGFNPSEHKHLTAEGYFIVYLDALYEERDRIADKMRKLYNDASRSCYSELSSLNAKFNYVEKSIKFRREELEEMRN